MLNEMCRPRDRRRTQAVTLEDAQPKPLHVVALLGIPLGQLVEILVRARIDFSRPTVDRLPRGGEEGALRPADLRWGWVPSDVLFVDGAVGDVVPELLRREAAADEIRAAPLHPAGEILDGVPVGEGVDLAQGEDSALGLVSSLSPSVISFVAGEEVGEIGESVRHADDRVESQVRVGGCAVVDVMNVALQEERDVG